MPTITFLPIQKKVEAQIGESILDVALSNGVQIQHACGGFCACTTCHCEVIEGNQNLTAADENEVERLEVLDLRTANSRLACQTKVKGDVSVRIVNLD